MALKRSSRPLPQVICTPQVTAQVCETAAAVRDALRVNVKGCKKHCETFPLLHRDFSAFLHVLPDSRGGVDCAWRVYFIAVFRSELADTGGLAYTAVSSLPRHHD